MSTLIASPRQVVPDEASPLATGVAGQSLRPGQPVAFDPADGKWKHAHGLGSPDLAGARRYGVALTVSEDGQPVVIGLPGTVVGLGRCISVLGNPGGRVLGDPGTGRVLGAFGAVVAGTVYFPRHGSLMSHGELGSGERALPIGLGLGGNAVQVLDWAYNAGAVVA